MRNARTCPNPARLPPACPVPAAHAAFVASSTPASSRTAPRPSLPHLTRWRRREWAACMCHAAGDVLPKLASTAPGKPKDPGERKSASLLTLSTLLLYF
ncbi:hypothetical protein B0H16DRAFT_1890672 [Mycena metata]|uniref:Uncharacterized protein n=1 Tax=Mycena metata TaxID=1033252 RepID=A0AAD7IEA2_9AGAR|nr:hypothetical protein B0H16DRAFT_1890672 [Mycena metata]